MNIGVSPPDPNDSLPSFIKNKISLTYETSVFNKESAEKLLKLQDSISSLQKEVSSLKSTKKLLEAKESLSPREQVRLVELPAQIDKLEKNLSVKQKESFGLIETMQKEGDSPAELSKKVTGTLDYISKKTESQDIEDQFVLQLNKDMAAIAVNKQEAVSISGKGEVPKLEESKDYKWADDMGSWQSQSFANFVLERWASFPQFGGLGLGAKWKSPQKEIFKDLNDAQPKIFNELFEKFASSVSASSFFDLDRFEDIILTDSIENEEIAGCTPKKGSSLLDIENAKNRVKTMYNNTCSDACDAGDPSKPGPLEVSGLKGLTYTIIRLHALEAMLRSMFVYSFFDMTQTFKDKLFIEFIYEVATNTLRLQGEDYYQEILKQAKAVTDERQKNGEILVDPFVPSATKEYESLSDPNHPNTLAGISSFKYLVLEQIRDLEPELSDRLKPAVEDVNEYFVNMVVGSAPHSRN